MSDSGDPKQDRQREQEAEREFYGTTDGTNTTPKSELVQTPSNNIEAELADILQRFADYKGKDESKWENCLTRGEATTAIKNLGSQATVQARIDELESHSNQWRVWQDDTTNVKLDDVIAWYDTRLAALQSQSKGE